MISIKFSFQVDSFLLLLFLIQIMKFDPVFKTISIYTFYLFIFAGHQDDTFNFLQLIIMILVHLFTNYNYFRKDSVKLSTLPGGKISTSDYFLLCFYGRDHLNLPCSFASLLSRANGQDPPITIHHPKRFHTLSLLCTLLELQNKPRYSLMLDSVLHRLVSLLCNTYRCGLIK